MTTPPRSNSTGKARKGIDAVEASLAPLAGLPQLNHRRVRLERIVRRWSEQLIPLFELEHQGDSFEFVNEHQVEDRASGLNRGGFTAQFWWPRYECRLAFGIETELAHAMVDRLLGFAPGSPASTQPRLRLSPVEHGLLTFLTVRFIAGLAGKDGPLGHLDLVVDRAGADPFEPGPQGPMLTVRWGVRVGNVLGSVRLWLPESLIARWEPNQERGEPRAAMRPLNAGTKNLLKLASQWRAEAGSVWLPRGLKTLKTGGVLPLSKTQLKGSPGDLTGQLSLAITLESPHQSIWVTAEPVAGTAGSFLKLTSSIHRSFLPREGRPLSQPNSPQDPGTEPTPSATSPTTSDLPVTLVIELGRVNLDVSQVASLKPGEVIELTRHSREPVELTSGGRLVARGELVQIDTELGVRITQVFL